ncbi:laccase [Xylogone sp. PMI_703]|nr:laccase [Xylogone sp. PMI_703]
MKLLETMQKLPRRRTLLAFCAVVAVIVSGFYVYSYYHSRYASAPSIVLDFLEPIKHPNTDYTSDPSASHSINSAPNVEEKANASFLLHPDQHIFRPPTTIRLAWNVTLEQRAPDGVVRPVYLINGQFPGPIIEARSGDELMIDVFNSVENAEGISIHWHGLYMKGANEMDGVVGLSQCAIGPFESFTYRFRVDDSQFGTFWYHSHSGLQRADGLFGGLVIHQPASNSTPVADISAHQQVPEYLLLVGDWYHRPAKAVFDWFQDPNHFGYEPAPDSLLINGRGSFNCSMAVKARPVECSPVERPEMTFGDNSRIKLRVVNTGASAGFSISFSQAHMTVVAVDGGNSVASNTPSATSVGPLYPGERMDLIVEHLMAPGTNNLDVKQGLEGASKLTVILDLENFRITNFALTPKQSFPVLWNSGSSKDTRRDESSGTNLEPVVHFSLAKASGSPVMAGIDIAKKPVATSVLYTKMSIRSASGLRPVGSVNHTSWIVVDPKAPPLLALDRSQWNQVTDQHSPLWSLDVPWYHDSREDRWMELVLNNIDDKGHPFHLHGYAFYIVSTGQAAPGYPGTYNPFDPAAAPPSASINTLNPLRKDTVYVPRNGHVVLRFPLDNDGLWFLHCHVLWHLASGMGMVIQVGNLAEGMKQRATELCSK